MYLYIQVVSTLLYNYILFSAVAYALCILVSGDNKISSLMPSQQQILHTKTREPQHLLRKVLPSKQACSLNSTGHGSCPE